MLYNNNIDESLLQVTSNPPLLRKQKAFNNLFELRTMDEVINEIQNKSETSNSCLSQTSNENTLQYRIVIMKITMIPIVIFIVILKIVKYHYQ